MPQQQDNQSRQPSSLVRRRRTASPKGLLALLLANVANTVSAASRVTHNWGVNGSSRTLCITSRSLELAELSACGDKGSINYCLSHIVPNSAAVVREGLEACFRNAGCTIEEAAIEAEWTSRRCDELADHQNMGDLRRRQGNGKPAADDDDSQDDKTTAKKDQPNTAKKDQPPTTSKKDEKKPTPAPAPQPQADNPGTTESVAATTSPAPQVTAPAVAQQQSQTSVKSVERLTCHTMQTVSTSSCPTQSTGSEAGKTLPCFPTIATFLVCAAGLLCQSDAQGLPTCIKIDNAFTAAGVAITGVFGLAAIIACAGIFFLCLRDRREERRIARAAEAAAIAQEARAAALLTRKRPSVNVRSVSGTSDVSQPLMPPAAPQGGHYGDGVLQDPFSDQTQQQRL